MCYTFIKTKSLILIFILLIVHQFLTTFIYAEDEYVEEFYKELDVKKETLIFAKNVQGNISLHPSTNGKLQIKAEKYVIAESQEEASKLLERIKVEVIDKGSTIEIKYDSGKKKWFGKSWVVDYDIGIPDGCDVEVSTISGEITGESIKGYAIANNVSGNIKLRDIFGDIKVSTVSGNIIVDRIAGETLLETVSGSITCISSMDYVKAKTVSGLINITSVSNGVKTETVSGDMELMNIQGDITANSTSGEIYVEIASDSIGVCDIESFSGDVIVRLPKSANCKIKAETFSGDINIDVDVKGSRIGSKRNFDLTVGNGGNTLKLETFSGNIDVKYKSEKREKEEQ